MYLDRKLHIYLLLLIVSLGFIPSYLAEDILYKNKPVWWDDIQVDTTVERKYVDSYYKTMAGLDYGGTKIENWSVLGPFENNKDKPFDKNYGPEETFSFDEKEEFDGLKGKIRWTPWSKGTKCPVDENQGIDKSVFFFHSRYIAPKSGKYTVIFSSDDGAEIWINKKKVFSETKPRGINLIDPNHFEVELKKGKNDILVKLENRIDSWALNMIVSPFVYEQARIKGRILLFNKAPKLSTREKRETCEQVSWFFLQNDDFPNYIFWFNHRAMNVYEPRTFLAGRTKELDHAIHVKKAAKPFVVDYYKEIFNNQKIPEKTRKYFIDSIIKDYLEREDTEGLVKFIDTNREQLEKQLPKKILEARIKIQIKKGDYKEASKLVEELKAICNESELRHYKYHLFPIVSNMKTSTIQIPVDWDEKTIQNEAEKLVGTKKSSTYRFIRKTLIEKAKQVRMTDDSELFSATLPVYKKMFMPYSKEYSSDLRSYLSLLKKVL